MQVFDCNLQEAAKVTNPDNMETLPMDLTGQGPNFVQWDGHMTDLTALKLI